MFRRRSGGSGRDGDIGLADAAVAVLGPVAFLWIVFQTVAVINSEPRCEALAEAEVQARGNQVKAWHDGEQRELARLADYWSKSSCGKGRPLPAATTSPAELLPKSLSGICAPERTQILAKAGLSSSHLASLAAQKAAYIKALSSCPGNSPCDRITTVEERQKKARELKAWYDERGKGLVEMTAGLGQLCPQVKVDAPAIPRSISVVPPALANVCPPDRPAVVVAAGIKQEAIDLQEQQLDAARKALRACRLPDAGCRSDEKLSKAERDTVVADLQDWYRNLRDAVKADRGLLEAKNCPAAVTPAIYANVVEPLRRHRICHNGDTPLIGEAGLTAGDVERLLQERARLVAGLRACVQQQQPETGCQRLDQAQLEKAGDELRSWHRAYRKQVEEDRALAERYCDQPTTLPPEIKPLAAPVFKSLKVCREQWPALIQSAQVSESEIDELQQRHGSVLHRLRGCVANETASRIERSIQFITCDTEFTSNDETRDSMSPDEVQASFEKIARAVLGNLAEGDRAGRPFNRIEVRGHTDERPIPPGKDCKGATTNAQLSSLRAHKFNEELLRAIERLAAGGDPDATRLLARLPRYHLELDERRRELDAKRKVLERRLRPKQLPQAGETDSASLPPPAGVRAQLARMLEQLRQIETLRESIASLAGRVEELRLYAIGVGSDEPAYKDIERYPDCSAREGEAEQKACRYRLDRRIEFRFVREAGRN